MNPSNENSNNNQSQPTSAADFRNAAQQRNEGEIVTLESGKSMKIARPSVSALMKTGQLPSELANAAVKVQSGAVTTPTDIVKFTEYQEKLVILSAKNPKVVHENANYDNGEINIGDLSDDEQTEIMIYVNGGLDALAKFRQERQRLSA